MEHKMDPVLVAVELAFGFVFIPPLLDRNGRLHRYIIHHALAKINYTQQGVIFPISASTLDHIKDYGEILEHYSHPILEYINGKPGPDNNAELLNETIDYYRYFDATLQAELLYDCEQDTIEKIISNEVHYLERYYEFKRYIDDVYEIPDKLLSLLS